MNVNENVVKIDYPAPVQINVDPLSEVLNKNHPLMDWPDNAGGMPNLFNRSSIFAAEKSDNTYFNNQAILSYVKDYEITYTGPALDKRDYQVFQLCLHAGKNSQVEMGRLLRIYPSEWFKILKRTDNGRSRDELYNSLKKLTAATVNVLKYSDGRKHQVSGSLLSVAYREEMIINDNGMVSKNEKPSKRDIKWLIAVNPYTKDLFLGDMTLLDIHRSANIKSHLGLWLHDFYSSHQKPIAIDIRKLYNLSGSKGKIGHFTQSLKENLDKLIAFGLIKEYSIEEKSKTEKLLKVVKASNSPNVGPYKIENNTINKNTENRKAHVSKAIKDIMESRKKVSL